MPIQEPVRFEELVWPWATRGTPDSNSKNIVSSTGTNIRRINDVLSFGGVAQCETLFKLPGVKISAVEKPTKAVMPRLKRRKA